MSVAESVPTAAAPQFVYRRHLHYAEWLKRVQGVVIGMPIPDEIMAAVAKKLVENQRRLRRAEVTRQCVRRALKDLHLFSYCHRDAEFLQRIYGVEPIRIDPLVQQELIRRFKVLDEIGCKPVSPAYLTAKLLASIDPDELRPLIDHFSAMAPRTPAKWWQNEQYVGAFLEKLVWPNVPLLANVE